MRDLSEFTGVTPLQLLRAVGSRVWVNPGSGFEFDTDCPVCGSPAGLDGGTVACPDTRCSFGVSRVVDLIAHTTGGYDQVLASVYAAIPEAAGHVFAREARGYVRRAQLRHWLKDHVMSNRGKDLSEGIQALGLVRRSGYPRLVEHDLVKVVTSEALRHLHASGYRVPRHPRPVIPLWTAGGEFAGIAFIGGASEVTFFDRQVLLGWEGGPACLGMSLAIQAGERFLGYGALPPRPILIPEHARVSDAAIDFMEPADAALIELGNAARALPVATVGGVALDDWMLGEITRTDRKALTPRARRLLSSCAVSTALQFRVEQALMNAGNLDAAMDVRNKLHHRTLFESDGVRVRASPHGYLADIKGQETKLTNFTLRMTRNLVFEDLANVYHEAEVEMAGRRWPVMLAAPDIGHQVKLQTAIRGQTPGAEVDKVPVIINPAKVQSLLLPWLRATVADLPPVLGVSNLGWGVDRGRFQGAGWMVSTDEVCEGSVMLQPGVEVFECFSGSAIHSDICPPEGMPIAARDIVATLAGLICRCYVRSRVKGVAIQNSHSARSLLKMVFASLGQRKPFDMPSNLRTQKFIQGLSGHPFWASGYNPLQIAACPLPGIFLADSGYAVGEADYSEVTLPATWVIRSVVSWLLATEGQEFEEKRAFHSSTALQLEGADAIAKAAKLECWEVSPPMLPVLEGVVRPYKADSVGAVCALDGDHVIIASDNPGDLLAELMGMAIPASRQPDGVRVPAMQLTPLLYDFYGTAPIYGMPGELSPSPAAT